MNLSKHIFPITLKNITNNKRVVGSLWFAPNEQLVVSEHVYQGSKSQIDYSLGCGYIVLKTDEEDALDNNSKEDKKDILDNDKSPEVLKDEDQDKDTDDKMTNKSVVDQFADKEIHWATAKKYIYNCDDLRELESLLNDSVFHNIPEDGAIVIAIRDRISIIQENKDRGT